MIEEWIKDLSMQAWAERKQALLLSGNIYRRLGKGARDRYTTLYRQYTDVVKMVQVADGAR